MSALKNGEKRKERVRERNMERKGKKNLWQTPNREFQWRGVVLHDKSRCAEPPQNTHSEPITHTRKKSQLNLTHPLSFFSLLLDSIIILTAKTHRWAGNSSLSQTMRQSARLRSPISPPTLRTSAGYDLSVSSSDIFFAWMIEWLIVESWWTNKTQSRETTENHQMPLFFFSLSFFTCGYSEGGALESLKSVSKRAGPITLKSRCDTSPAGLFLRLITLSKQVWNRWMKWAA